MIWEKGGKNMKKQRLLLNKGEIAVCALKALAKTDEQVAEETG